MLVACNLTKTFRRNANQVQVLNGLSLEVMDGEFLSVTGASGSGKSTLLHLLGTLDFPDSGEIYLHGQRIDHLPQSERDQLRSQTFGFIFQFYHLLPELSMLENVLMPTMIHASAWRWLGERRAYRKRAVELLERFGLGHRLKHRPRELSGGEMQRTAIARALICQPRILLADEPTGNLDAEAGHEILGILRDLNRRDGLTMIMVTHNQEMAATTDRVVRLVGGRMESESTPAEPAKPLAAVRH
jgi:lipoprotein-releasing system ATP-binding protein